MVDRGRAKQDHLCRSFSMRVSLHPVHPGRLSSPTYSDVGLYRKSEGRERFTSMCYSRQCAADEPIVSPLRVSSCAYDPEERLTVLYSLGLLRVHAPEPIVILTEVLAIQSSNGPVVHPLNNPVTRLVSDDNVDRAPCSCKDT